MDCGYPFIRDAVGRARVSTARSWHAALPVAGGQPSCSKREIFPSPDPGPPEKRGGRVSKDADGSRPFLLIVSAVRQAKGMSKQRPMKAEAGANRSRQAWGVPGGDCYSRNLTDHNAFGVHIVASKAPASFNGAPS